MYKCPVLHDRATRWSGTGSRFVRHGLPASQIQQRVVCKNCKSKFDLTFDYSKSEIEIQNRNIKRDIFWTKRHVTRNPFLFVIIQTKWTGWNITEYSIKVHKTGPVGIESNNLTTVQCKSTINDIQNVCAIFQLSCTRFIWSHQLVGFLLCD